MAARNDRWAAHPAWAAAVRLVVFLVPVGLSILTAVVVGRLLPAGDSTGARIGWWLVVFAVSSVALFLTDRLARRLLPLAVLLELSLVFPDRAPSRLRSVRTASVQEVERRLLRLRDRNATSAPNEAAETLVTLVGVLGIHDKRTRGHSERVRAYVDLLTDEMGLPEDQRERARWAALVHDLGKLSVPAAVLNKPAALDDDEWDVVRRHPEEGTRLVAGLLPWLGEWGRAIGEHHERWDGLGYPNGLAGEDIALPARIVSVADSFEVMTSNRAYSRARAASVAREELTACAGAQFDPLVVRHFLSISIGRLRWVFGPLTWLAEFPLLAADRVGQGARLAAGALGVGGLAVAGVLVPSTHSDAAQDRAGGDGARPVATATSSPSASSPPAPGSGPTAGTDGSAAPVATASASRAASSTAAASPSARPAAATSPRPATSPSPSPRTSPSPTRAPAPGPQSASPTPPPAVPPSTYWFTASSGGYSLAPTAPSSAGTPPDVDGDGKPGYTLEPSTTGLDTTARNTRLVLALSVPRPLRLNGVPTVELWSRLAATKGNGRVLLRLQDCASTCTTLADGQIEDGTWSSGTTFGSHSIDLAAVDVTVLAGHQLRLIVVASDNGTSGKLLVAVSSRSAPSRIVLPVR